jgi:Fe-S-cluster-containing hydrogenase component 2
LAGADCIDVAADPAVILAVQEAMKVAVGLANAGHLPSSAAAETLNNLENQSSGYRFLGAQADTDRRNKELRSVTTLQKPLLMVSLNDGEDPHFRKAEFDAARCPADCSRPCEWVCPAGAIDRSGVLSDRCYGCGRCLPVCPQQLIFTRSSVTTPQAIAPLILEMGVDAIEIHTQVGRFADFERLWSAIRPWVKHLKVLAISCPDGEGLLEYLRSLYDLISPLPCPLIWQTDGRPMSGDIGTGATRAAVKLGQKVLAAHLPGYVQLAGGTNSHTVPKLRALGLLPHHTENGSIIPAAPESRSLQRYVSGVAYGSYARALLGPILAELETPLEAPPEALRLARSSPELPRLSAPPPFTYFLEAMPDQLAEAVNLCSALVSQMKPFPNQSPIVQPMSHISPQLHPS